MHISFFRLFIFVAIVSVLVPVPSKAAERDITISGWMPYWRDSESIEDAEKHISKIDTVYPFVFSVTSDGSIKDLGGLTDKEWKSFIKTAQGENVEIIPTIMWSDADSIHSILSDSESRKRHIEVITHMVEKGKFDGVDIDYENKNTETINYFSLFLLELKKELGNKILSCTVEARTPSDSLYKEIPLDRKYANDYKMMNMACDRVVIMAYDQQRADIKLNAERIGTPYMPVADVDWVEKVVKLTLESFPKKKLVLGIPTYGNHYAITVAPDWYRDYRRIGALNIPDIKDVAREYKVTPTRNSAGEMSFTYLPKDTDKKIAKAIKRMSVPKNTPKGNRIATQALAYANKKDTEVTFNFASYSDAGAMLEKVDLAKKYGLRGVSLFKIDGEEDQKFWKSF